MKIAYLSADSGIPIFGNKGAAVHIRELVNALSALGHQVTIFTARRGAVSGSLSAEVIEVRADPVPPSMEESVNGSAQDLLLKEQRSLRLSAAILNALLTRHAQEPFDVIYERYSLWSAAAVRAAHALNIPCVVEVNAPLVEEQQRYRGLVLTSEAAAIEAEVFGRADAVLTVSDRVKAHVVAKGGCAERTLVVPNGVDTSRFHPAVDPESLPEAEGKFVIGFAGSFKVWHGIDVLLEAFRMLRGHSTDSHLLMVGDGPLRSWIEGYIQGACLQGHVTITGWVAYERLPGLVQRMDVGVAPYPALEDFYFSPLKLFEYMAVGKPIVASRLGQIQDVLRDQLTGLLVEAGNPAALAEAIERLRQDQGLRTSLGRAAADAARQHTWERNASQIVALAEPLVRTQ